MKISILGGVIMPFCSSCGSKATDNAKFCWKCGKPLRMISTSVETRDSTQKEETDRYKNLSLQELINLANGGDSEAMIRVGVYYLSLDPNLDINGKGPKRIARDWMEKAALAGHAGGIPFICSTYDAVVNLSEIANGPSDQNVINIKRECNKWYQLGYKLYMNKAPGFESIKDFQEFKSDMDRARYQLACSEFISESFDEAQRLVSGHNDIPSQIVDLLVKDRKISDRMADKISRNESLEESEIKEYRDVISRLEEILLFDDDYCARPKVINEELIYAYASTNLSSHYINVSKDYDRAFTLLNKTRNNLKNEKFIYLIDNELSHFRRNDEGEIIYI